MTERNILQPGTRCIVTDRIIGQIGRRFNATERKIWQWRRKRRCRHATQIEICCNAKNTQRQHAIQSRRRKHETQNGRNKHSQRQQKRQVECSRQYKQPQHAQRQKAVQHNTLPKHVVDYVVHTKNKHGNECNDVSRNYNEVRARNEPARAPPEYAVDCIVHHVGKVAKLKYFKRWYGYSSADNTFEPPSHSPQHFITLYWYLVRGNGAWRYMTRHKDENDRYKENERVALNLLVFYGLCNA